MVGGGPGGIAPPCMWARGMGSPAMAVKDMGVMVDSPDTH